MKLAEALLRRKELQSKLERMKTIKERDLFEVKVQRKAAHEGFDDVIAQVPKLQLNQVTEEFDYYASQLRRIDAAIQNANWQTDVNADPVLMIDFPSRATPGTPR